MRRPARRFTSEYRCRSTSRRSRPPRGLEPLEDRRLLSTAPLQLGGDASVHPEDFRVTVFASGLDFPYAVDQLSDGSLIIGASPSATGNLFDSTGTLRRFVDTNDDGVADANQLVFSGLPGTVTAVKRVG